jgi:hypothetical protein
MELIMRYINGGVTAIDPASPVKTKKALRDAAKAGGEDVVFYSTAAEWFGSQWEGRLSEIPEGVSLSVVGPDPYTSRRWYAQVSRSKEGKVRVS